MRLSFQHRRTTQRAWKRVTLSGLAALLSLCLSCASAPPPVAALSADLDGDSSTETVEASVRGGKVKLQARDARGKLLGKSDAPAPRGGALSVSLAKGELGSSGALWEVTASTGREECRSVWRLRAGKPDRLPILAQGTSIPACAPAGGWTTRFERIGEDVPATYVRERSRTTPRGLHGERQVFSFSGFQMDLVSSTDEINGVVIPDWYEAVLYPRQSLKALAERYDLSPVTSLPRLRLETDGPAGLFTLRLTDSAGTLEAPVRARTPGEDKNRVNLEARAEPAAAEPEKVAEVKVELAANGEIPIEVEVRGLGPRFDFFYVPVTRVKEGALQVFPSAEAELVSENLTGVWSSEKGENVAVDPIPNSHTRLRFDREDVSVRLDGAPEGSDLLLVPAGGAAPSWALDLQGPNALARLPVRCPGWPESPEPCEGAGSGEVLRRVGARVNLR